jgi:hypothetical protein
MPRVIRRKPPISMKDTFHESLTASLPGFHDLIGNTGLIPTNGNSGIRFSEEYLRALFSSRSLSSNPLAFWEDITDFIKRLDDGRGHTKFWIQDFCLDRAYNEADDKFSIEACESFVLRFLQK